MSQSYPSCKNTIKNLLALGYKQKSVYTPYIKGQKYYEVTTTVPNCVRSFVCDKVNEKEKGVVYGDRAYRDQCYVKKFNYKDSNGNIIEKENTSYMVPLENNEKNTFYRSCVPFGCKKGTSAIDIIDSSGGGRRRTYKKSRNFRKSRRTRK